MGAGIQTSQSPLIFRKKFNPVKVDGPVANLSTNPDRFIGCRILEFDFHLAAHGQVRRSKQANAALTQPYTASVNNRLVHRVIDDNTKLRVKRAALPTASIWLCVHRFQSAYSVSLAAVTKEGTPE